MKMISPFDGLSSLQRNKLLKILESHTYSFDKNDEILSQLKSTNIICILLEGYAKIIATNYLGEEALIEELTENSILGTNTSNIDNSEYRIMAIEPCKILIIDYNKLINTKNLNYPYYSIKFISNIKYKV